MKVNSIDKDEDLIFNDALTFKIILSMVLQKHPNAEGEVEAQSPLIAIPTLRELIKPGSKIKWWGPGIIDQARADLTELRKGTETMTAATLDGVDVSRNGDRAKALNLVRLLPVARQAFCQLTDLAGEKSTWPEWEKAAVGILEVVLERLETLQKMFGDPPTSTAVDAGMEGTQKQFGRMAIPCPIPE